MVLVCFFLNHQLAKDYYFIKIIHKLYVEQIHSHSHKLGNLKCAFIRDANFFSFVHYRPTFGGKLYIPVCFESVGSYVNITHSLRLQKSSIFRGHKKYLLLVKQVS